MRKVTRFMSRFLILLLFLALGQSWIPKAQAVQANDLTYCTTRGSDVLKIKPMDGTTQIYEFWFNEQVVMRYRTMAQGLSAKERALIIWERANKLGETLKEGEVAVACLGGSYVVTLDHQLFITVTEADYRMNNSTGKGLAEVWAQNLQKARREDIHKEDNTRLQDNLPTEAPVQAELTSPKENPVAEPTATVTATAEELKMLELINAERAKVGVKPLVMKSELVKIARLKSQDMIDKNYFSHTSPTYGDPFTMMKKFGIEYGYAGENLAGNPSVENAHESLMNSSGHKKNILNPNYTHVGIGIVNGGVYGKIFTQLFTSKP